MGLDATIPWIARDGSLLTLEERSSFQRVAYQSIDLRRYL
jgi:hypothetical protein